MAYALDLVFDIPPAWGYLICALVVIPLVTHGVTAISRLQVWTQPLWLVMLVVPFVAVFWQPNPASWAGWCGYAGDGRADEAASFDLLAFGAATTVGIALITQMGEQVDYLRFMPEPQPGPARALVGGGVLGGPGWVIPGVLKMLGGALLAYLAITHMVPVDRAVDPNQMYLAAYELVFGHYGWAVAATALFVVVSQLKINVTNAYAGSLAWSNFFSRLTHSHPGRVVWMVFNTAIALALMEMNVFQALGHVLGPVRQRRHRLDDGRGGRPGGQQADGLVAAGHRVQARASVRHQPGRRRRDGRGVGAVGGGAPGRLRAAGAGLLGRHRAGHGLRDVAADRLGDAGPLLHRAPVDPDRAAPAAAGAYKRLLTCGICEREYETEDMAHCPAYQAPICSLCCTLDARCNDLCKPQARLSDAVAGAAAAAAAASLGAAARGRAGALPAADGCWCCRWWRLLLGAVYQQGRTRAGRAGGGAEPLLRQGVLNVGVGLLLVAGVVAWWLVLAHRSRLVAQEESNRQTQALLRRDRVAPPHRRRSCSRPRPRPTPPTRPRRATSPPSATNCARR